MVRLIAASKSKIGGFLIMLSFCLSFTKKKVNKKANATQNLNHTTMIGATSFKDTFIKIARKPQKSAVVAAYKIP